MRKCNIEKWKYYNWSSLESMKVKSYLKNSCSRNVARLATKFEKIDSKLMCLTTEQLEKRKTDFLKTWIFFPSLKSRFPTQLLVSVNSRRYH